MISKAFPELIIFPLLKSLYCFFVYFYELSISHTKPNHRAILYNTPHPTTPHHTTPHHTTPHHTTPHHTTPHHSLKLPCKSVVISRSTWSPAYQAFSQTCHLQPTNKLNYFQITYNDSNIIYYTEIITIR